MNSINSSPSFGSKIHVTKFVKKHFRNNIPQSGMDAIKGFERVVQNDKNRAIVKIGFDNGKYSFTGEGSLIMTVKKGRKIAEPDYYRMSLFKKYPNSNFLKTVLRIFYKRALNSLS